MKRAIKNPDLTDDMDSINWDGTPAVNIKSPSNPI